MTLRQSLYRAARLLGSAESLRTPSKAGRRARNLAVGRALARGGFWRRLWGGGR